MTVPGDTSCPSLGRIRGRLRGVSRGRGQPCPRLLRDTFRCLQRTDSGGRRVDTLEAMGSAVSMRWLKPDAVPDELLEQALWAATRASSPNNSQPWAFVVVRDKDVRVQVAELIRPGYAEVLGSFEEQRAPTDASQRRTLAGARHLVENLARVPVLIFVCGSDRYPPGAPQERGLLSATYSAAQNLLVAARALGLGAAFTTIHMGAEEEIKGLLAMPDDTTICVTMPLGWPERPFGNLNRKPLSEVVHYDRW
jgi:nitroreductase